MRAPCHAKRARYKRALMAAIRLSIRRSASKTTRTTSPGSRWRMTASNASRRDGVKGVASVSIRPDTLSDQIHCTLWMPQSYLSAFGLVRD
jgi:hypothetical protein